MKEMKQFGILTFAFLLINSTVIIKNASAQMRVPHELPTVEMAEDNDFSIWCNDALMTLRRGQTNARHAYAVGRHSEALVIFGQTLAAYVHSPNPGVINSMTYRLIVRAHHIRSILSTQMRSERDVRTASLFMDSMFDFILDTAQNLDLNYYRGPFGGCGRRCLRNYMQEAENLLLTTAFDQVNLALSNFYQEYSGRVTPVGSPRVVLKITQLLLEGAIQDLESTLAANYYACAIVNLSAAHSEIASYNANPNSLPYIVNLPQAVAHFYYNIKNAVDNRPRCGF